MGGPGPRPLKVVSEKEKANLKRTAGPGRPKKSEAQKEHDAWLKGLPDRPAYRAKLEEDWDQRKVHPAIESLVLQMKYGKPKDVTEHQFGPARIEIIHKLRAEIPVKDVKVLPPSSDEDE